ncbi:hypothetical protein EVAR_84275_1 [Eumeta japonica]|uniref:Uncharacterized protein n=1 Tax=Eumeta variegata TaxID=151549 RepID=A0A4C1WR96_EUMVA|nr:hypothetical protein EVAR_84275_1 [Eumeta japonica]
MCIISAVVYVAFGTMVYHVLWVARSWALCCWSYALATHLFPEDSGGRLLLATALASLVTAGTVLPTCLFPSVSFWANVVTIFPQVHILFLLHRKLINIDNVKVHKTLRALTLLSLISTVWNIYMATLCT